MFVCVCVYLWLGGAMRVRGRKGAKDAVKTT
jgi:hypothetical protein